MRGSIVLCLALLAAASSMGQTVKESAVSPATKRYRAYRIQDTEPSYGLEKVKAAIKATKPTKGDEMESKALSPAAWSRLSKAERFTYCMLHGEEASQNCEAMPWIVDEEHKVFAYPPPFNGGEENWSARQRTFLATHRGAVVALLRSTLREKGRVGVNLKAAIVELHANELIPDLAKVYRRDHRDQDILSVLMLLMKDGKFKPFLGSITFRKLYGEGANYQAFIVANDANQKLMLERALAFYRSRVGVTVLFFATVLAGLKSGVQGRAEARAPVGAFAAVPAGGYRLGKTDHIENPARTVRLKGFLIARTETTNAQFAAFVRATGYVTDAERRHNAMVFQAPLPEFRWIHDPSADWRFPNGRRRGDLTGKADHPVTTVSYADAQAYCRWAKVRLPTLDEWEAACRAGTTTDYSFGSDRAQIGRYANVWHGRDHLKPDLSDGYETTAPVARFAPNPLGLYDMYGNVFEFCTGRLPGDRSSRRVHARGGSWWCSASACCFFNSVDIGGVDVHASFSNQGFRVVR